MARRHERFARLPLPRLQPGNQDERAAHGSREPGGAVHQRGESGRPLHPGALPAHDAEPADPHDAARMEVRLPVALQGRGLLLQHAPLHGPEVGHDEPRHDARRRVRDDPPARVRHVRDEDRRREGVLRDDRRDGRPHDDRRDHRPAPFDDPLAPVGRDRRVEDRRARPRVEVRRALGPRPADSSRPSSRATASSSRGSSSRTSRCPKRSRPRSTSARSWASSATAWASTRSSRPPTR